MSLLSDFGNGILSNFGRGGGVGVVTTYLSNLNATLDAGFTTSGGRKYNAWSQDPADTTKGFLYLEQKVDYALKAGLSTVTVTLFDGTTATITTAQAVTDLKEVSGNYYNAINHVYTSSFAGTIISVTTIRPGENFTITGTLLDTAIWVFYGGVSCTIVSKAPTTLVATAPLSGWLINEPQPLEVF